MKTTLTIENIYSMLSSLSVNNKKWLADHLYEDISGVQVRRRRGALSDEELEAELSGSPLLDMIEVYSRAHFLSDDGTPCLKNIVEITTEQLQKYGLRNTAEIQECCGFTIYPKDYFCPSSPA